MQKNDEVVLDIIDLSNEGLGIGKVEGFPIFVKGAIIGDKVKVGITKVKKTYAYGRVISIIEESVKRTESKCKVATRCGGCQIQNMKYVSQLEYKNDKVKQCLARLGDVRLDDENVEFRDIIGMAKPWNYRNKAQFPVGIDAKGNLALGFYANYSHSIIDTDSCLILHKVNDFIIKGLKEFFLLKTGNLEKDNDKAQLGELLAKAKNKHDKKQRKSVENENEKLSVYDEKTQKGLLRHILTRVGYSTSEVMVCFVINGDKLPLQSELIAVLENSIREYNESFNENLKLKCVAYNINKENTNVILGEKVVTIYGEPYIHDYIGNIKYRISPLSFYQVNPVQTEKLYSTALEFANLSGDEVVWDIYCGIGTISLFLAQKAKKVYGVEIVSEAVKDAKENALINGINNTEFFAGAAEEVVPQMYEKHPEMRADVIVVDPPRKGCDEKLLSTIIKLEPKKVVYVSCDPATLARDIKYLRTQGNYILEKVQPVDMFPNSCHVETVCLLSKQRVNQ